MLEALLQIAGLAAPPLIIIANDKDSNPRDAEKSFSRSSIEGGTWLALQRRECRSDCIRRTSRERETPGADHERTTAELCFERKRS